MLKGERRRGGGGGGRLSTRQSNARFIVLIEHKIGLISLLQNLRRNLPVVDYFMVQPLHHNPVTLLFTCRAPVRLPLDASRTEYPKMVLRFMLRPLYLT